MDTGDCQAPCPADMVHLSKLLKLGGFSDQVKLLRAQVEHFGFAKKLLPPDTPHSEDKPRWIVNALGQKVIDTGTPVETIRELYKEATEKTYAIPETATIHDRRQLIVERCDHIRHICALAEKGDEGSGEYLLEVLAKDPATEVRKTILSKIIFAARGPSTPYNIKMIDGSLFAIADEVAEIRGLAAVLQERAIREWDFSEVHVLIPPQKRKDIVTRRGECSAPGAAIDQGPYSRGKDTVGSGAWQQVRDLAMAVQEKDLLVGVINMMRHPVLPVRIAAWETFGANDAGSTKGRCRELEALSYQNKLRYEEMLIIEKQLQRETAQCLESIMEANRVKITEKIEKERLRAELTAAQVERIVADFRDELTQNDPDYMRAKKLLDAHLKKQKSFHEELEKDFSRYKMIVVDLENEIMKMIGLLLEEKSAVLEGVNKVCGSNSKGNWYVRRCLIRILEPMAIAGKEDAIKMIEKSRDDRSPYVRRTVHRSMRAVHLAERERIATAEIFEQDLVVSRPMSVKERTEEEIAAEEMKNALAGLGDSTEDCAEDIKEPILEEKRRSLKTFKARQEEKEEEQRLKSIYVRGFDFKEVLELLESMRPKFADRTDVYKKYARLHKYSGELLYQMSLKEDQFIKAFKMSQRKHRIALKMQIKALMDRWQYATDEDKKEQRNQDALQSAARDSATRLNALTKVKLSEKGGALIKSAYRFDNYAYGSSTGLGSMLHRSKGHIIFRRVIPCGGLVHDGDTLIKIGGQNVAGMTLLEVKRMFETIGEMAPCLVRLTSEKELMKEIEEANLNKQNAEQGSPGSPKTLKKKKKGGKAGLKVADDLLRTVHITCQPPPFRDEYLESIGLDVEVYQGDATRSLQVMTFLQRHGFSSLLSRMLVDLHIKKLVQLAERYNDDTWILSVGIKKTTERVRFKKLLERLAFRYGMRDHVPDINIEDKRPNAHEGWMFITGFQNAVQTQQMSSYRTFDNSQDIQEFKRFGRQPVAINSKFCGMEYTICWHPELKMAVELMHASSGTLRIAKLSESQDLTRATSFTPTASLEQPPKDLPGVSGNFNFFVVFSDGRMEPTDKLNATGLLLELVSQPPPKDPVEHAEFGSNMNSWPGTSELPGLQYSRPTTSHSGLPTISDALETMHEENFPSPRSPQKGPRPGTSSGKDQIARGGEVHGTNPGGKLQIVTSGSHLGSPKWNKGFRFLVASRPSASESKSEASIISVSAGHTKDDLYNPWGGALKKDEIPEKRDRSWYVKGAGRGPGRGYFGQRQFVQRQFVKDGDKFVEAQPMPPIPHAIASEESNRAGVVPYAVKNGAKKVVTSGGHMGFFSPSKKGGKSPNSSVDDDSDAESDIDSDDEEEVVGYHVEPLVGHRVIVRATCAKKFPEIVKETGNTTGTITWVDPTDADGDGVTGDISEVKWDNGYIGDYRTGFEGTYRLCLDPDEDDINTRINIGAEDDEQVVGLDVEPLEGQRVVLMAQSIRDNPSLWEDSKGGPGTILWVDPEDADGDGITGDICEVEWDLTGLRADYRTGFEGAFRLSIFDPEKHKKKQRDERRRSLKQETKSLGVYLGSLVSVLIRRTFDSF